MSDEPQTPFSPEDDVEIQDRLRHLGRLLPTAGFESRVLAHVRHPLPRWARRVRNAVRSLLTGPRGWLVLGSMSLATAAAWAVGIGAALHYREYVERGWNIAAPRLALPWWREALVTLREQQQVASDTVAAAVANLGVSVPVLAVGYGAVVIVCLVALRRLMAVPARTRG